ncbi:MAG: hypothetical protein JO219_10800 [Candidatus Eremiobacteraeota bacterium]|nr:hypothetical protein [Candidatus Eremiobacteraeota bacterium]MBV8366075.1 hypothetical protein [Candidatus Eremiobacteraeota bacterium]
MSLCVVFIWAMLLADAAPATPAPAPAAMAPAPAPTIKPDQWQGVTLGESIDTVRTRLGPPDFNRKVILGSMLVEYPIHGGEGSLVLETSGKAVTSIRVEAPAPKQLSLPIGDPFGVNLGDSVTRLLTLRGQPSRMYDDGPDDSSTIYGASNENRWIYSIHSSTVVAITLIAPKPPQPPATPGPPGLVLQGTPKPHHGTVIKGTPAPARPAVASPASPAVAAGATPNAAMSPTPIPGIALPAPNPTSGPARPTPRPTPTPVAAATPTPRPAAAGSSTPNAIALASPAAIEMTPRPVTAPVASAQPADGSSVETAIVVRAPDMATGFDYIYKFVENISCGDGSSQYRITGQDITSEHRHNYAKITAECPTTHDRRLFYFDVTAIFTKSTER